MVNAIAVWNYCWNAAEVCGWIEEFADHGFQGISFHPDPFSGDAAGHLGPVVETLHNRNLIATVHGSVSMDPLLMKTMVEAMGDRLAAFTMDSCMREDSRGRLHHAKRISTALTRLQELTDGTGVRLAVEDFPLDSLAINQFATDLDGVYEHPRTGILVDVGHMHIRMNKSEYFGGMSVSEYFRRLPVPLVEVHLHDNCGERDQHAHFGFGSVRFPEIADALVEIGFDGVCTIEIAPGFHGRAPDESKPDAIRSLESWQRLVQRGHERASRQER